MSGVNFIGMPFGLHGLGQCMREQIRGIRSAGIDICLLETDYSSLREKQTAEDLVSLVADLPKHDINIICLNLPMIRILARDHPSMLANRYNIAVPYFEFYEFPDEDVKTIEYLDEIWVSNDFLLDVFSGITDKPVIKLPLFMELDRNLSRGSLMREKDDDVFTFGYAFDCNSMVARKDPVALIVSFLDCFGHDLTLPVKLVIKYKYEHAHYLDYSEMDLFKELASKDSRIELIDAVLSEKEMFDLFNSFDVYVSPHRAEGLGRGIFEAMLMGKAVIATNYSGPKEFLNPEYSFPVECYSSEVASAFTGGISANSAWRDISIDGLSKALQYTFKNQEETRKKGALARVKMMEISSELIFGEAGKKRLLQIADDIKVHHIKGEALSTL